LYIYNYIINLLFIVLIVTEKPLWGVVNKVLYCIEGGRGVGGGRVGKGLTGSKKNG
jgi:hypothetical protein